MTLHRPHERRAAFTSVSMGTDGTLWAVDATGAALRQTADGQFVPAATAA